MIHARLCQPIVIRARAHTTRPLSPRNRAAPSTVIARAPATARTQNRHCTLAGLRPATSCLCVQSRPARQPSGLGAIGTGGDCPVKPGNDACWMAGGISCRDAPSSLSSPPHTRHRTRPTRDCTRPHPSLHALGVQSRPARQPRYLGDHRAVATCAAERPACRRW